MCELELEESPAPDTSASWNPEATDRPFDPTGGRPPAGPSGRPVSGRDAAGDDRALTFGPLRNPGQEARLDALLTRLPLLLFELDRDGRFTLSLGKGLALDGMTPGHAVGCSIFDLCAGHPDILDAARAALGGREVAGTVEVGGRVIDIAYTPKRDADGAPGGVIGVAYDVTERHRNAAALRESEARLRDFAEACSDWLWETDEEHRFTWVNERVREALGVDPAGVLGRRRSEFRGHHPADGDWEEHARALAERRPFRDFRYGFADEAGRRRVVTVSGVPGLRAGRPLPRVSRDGARRDARG